MKGCIQDFRAGILPDTKDHFTLAVSFRGYSTYLAVGSDGCGMK